MNRLASNARWLFLCVAVLLGGCISNTPIDLAVASIQAVDWRDQDEMPGPGASPILGMAPRRTLALMGQSITGGPKPPRLLLKIEFTTTTNLSKFVIENSYSLGNTAYFCDSSKDPRTAMLSFPAVHWRGMRLGQHEPDPIERSVNTVGMSITYYIFIDAAQENVVPSNPPREAYDLRQEPRDICFYVAGGNNSGFGYKSNILIVSKASIEAALQRLPPGFGN